MEVCASKNEFEGSYERVEFERLLLEAHHKYAAATTEMNRLKTEGARSMSASGRNALLKKSRSEYLMKELSEITQKVSTYLSQRIIFTFKFQVQQRGQ